MTTFDLADSQVTDKIKRNVRTFWSNERCDELRRLWDDNLSASDIAHLMKCSRNAVIGKSHRLNLPQRREPNPPKPRTSKKRNYHRRVEVLMAPPAKPS